LSDETQAIIWDFYVTRSFANSASQKRQVKDFGISQIPFDEMIKVAKIKPGFWKILPCSSMKNTLVQLDLETERKIKNSDKKEEIAIDIETPRFCCLQPFTVNEELKILGSCSQAECLFTHIRNSFAHGNTYFFDNGNILLEDKSGKTTAKILISTNTLVDWIKLIDSKHLIYPQVKSNSASMAD